MDSSESLVQIIKRTSIFSHLSEEIITDLLSQFTQLTLDAGETLFHQDDPSDFIYILVKGELSAIMVSKTGDQVVGVVRPGESVGELGALSGLQRSLTVRAATESQLIGLSSYMFAQICQDHLSVLSNTMIPIINRSLQTIKLLQENKISTKYTVIFSSHNDISLVSLKEKLLKFFSSQGRVKCISSELLSMVQCSQEIEAFGQDDYHFIFIADRVDEQALHYLIEKKSHFYVVASGRKSIVIDAGAEQVLATMSANPTIKLQLVLLYPDGSSPPTYTKNWLDAYHFSLHHHIRMDREGDVQRLGRFISGSAVGVVFGGGGAKGMAHLGVIKALLERNVPIDAVGGTSIGAFAAIFYALTQSYYSTAEDFCALLEQCHRSIAVRNVVWPVISMFSSNPATDYTKRIFGDLQVENTWLPFFCMSSNLSESHEVVHRTGPVWEAIRATASLPGIFPPLLINRQLHVDGGLLNNLPVDVMKGFLGYEGKVIASKLSNQHAGRKRYDFPPVLTLRQTLLAIIYRLFRSRLYKFPHYFDVFISSLLLGASFKEEENGLAADVLVNPDVSGFKLVMRLDKRKEHVINLGYQETLKVLDSLNIK